MSEQGMIAAMETALEARGIEDKLVAVGQFAPRGQSGGMSVGGLIGDAAGVAGTAAGTFGGWYVPGKAEGLPPAMMVGVSPTVYGFGGWSRSKPPKDLLFRVPRAGLDVEVHQRVGVRVLELIDKKSGSRIELEGYRNPLTYSKRVIDALRS
jgi:hypothetical protein